jgi:uncharacterized protein (TIGR02117 family)
MLRAMRVVLLCVILLGGCAGTTVVEVPPGPADRSFFVVPQGGHTGIAVRRDDIPEALVPEKRDFPGTDWLEFGWGDRDFYRAETAGPWVTFKAAFLPTASVVHVVGVHGPLRARFAQSEILEIRVSRAALERMLRYVHDAFAREGPAAHPLGRGFYPGRETFHLLRTCNVWTARALRAAGLPVGDALTVEGILRQVRPLGRRSPSATRSPDPGTGPG